MDSNKRQSLINRFVKPRTVVASGVLQLSTDASVKASDSDCAMTEAANADIRGLPGIRVYPVLVQQTKMPKLWVPKLLSSLNLQI